MTGKHAVGLNVRAEASGRSQILGLLLRDSVIEVGERSTDRKWARIAKIVEGGIDSVRSDGSVPPEAASGWVFLAELDPEPTPVAFDEVVVLDEPHVVKQGDVLGYLGEDVPSRANPIANQPVSRRLLHLEVFSGDDVPAYLAASRQWAGATLGDKERTLLLLRPGDTLHTEPNGAVACTLNWAQVLPLSTLESKEVDGQRWRKVKGLVLDNGRMGEGWAKEAGHLASPWEWPGFDVVDEHASSSGGIFEDAAAWAGFIKKEGPRPEETPFYKQLRRMLDTNHDDLVSEQELDAALRDRSKAAHMARIIVRHDSAWAKEPAVRQRNMMARIAELLGPGAVEQVEAEAARAGKLPWWDEVAASVDGFPKAPRVYHFHPGGVAGNYIAPALDDLKVSRGQVTFDAEGNDAPGSAYFSRRLHWPGGASGVTLGRGYDMKHRTQEAVHADLVSAGVDESSARDFAQGAGLAGQAAQRFVSTHREEFGEISRTAQRILFESIVYPRYEEAAQRQYREATHENANLMAWEQLDVRVRDIAVDLTYQQGSIWKRQLPYIVGNDREALAHYIESTQELARYEPGRRRARYLRR